MKRLTFGLRLLAVLFSFSLIPGTTQAQDAAVKFDKVEAEFGQPPNVGAKGLPRARSPKNWMIVNFNYESFPYEGQDFLDEITFKVYIEGAEKEDAKDRDGVTVVLTGEVTYINIPAGKDINGVFFVNADAVERYDIERKTNTFNIRVEAMEKGKLADFVEKNRREDSEDWFTAYGKKEGLVLNQNQSPWVSSSVSAFPQIKMDKK